MKCLTILFISTCLSLLSLHSYAVSSPFLYENGDWHTRNGTKYNNKVTLATSNLTNIPARVWKVQLSNSIPDSISLVPDLNGDLEPDILFDTYNSLKAISYSEIPVFSLDDFQELLAIQDVNHDGLKHLFLLNTNGTISLYSAQYALMTTTLPGHISPYSDKQLWLEDIDNDDITDCIVKPYGTNILRIISFGAGDVSAPYVLSTLSLDASCDGVVAIEFLDWNINGCMEMIVAGSKTNGNYISTFISDVKDGFTIETINDAAITPWQNSDILPVNGNHKTPQLAVKNIQNIHTDHSVALVKVLQGFTSNTEWPPTQTVWSVAYSNATSLSSLYIADVNGNNRSDLVFSYATNNVPYLIALNLDTGAPLPGALIPNVSLVSAADINHDGQPEFLVHAKNTSGYITNSYIYNTDFSLLTAAENDEIFTSIGPIKYAPTTCLTNYISASVIVDNACVGFRLYAWNDSSKTNIADITPTHIDNKIILSTKIMWDELNEMPVIHIVTIDGSSYVFALDGTVLSHTFFANNNTDEHLVVKDSTIYTIAGGHAIGISNSLITSVAGPYSIDNSTWFVGDIIAVDDFLTNNPGNELLLLLDDSIMQKIALVSVDGTLYDNSINIKCNPQNVTYENVDDDALYEFIAYNVQPGNDENTKTLVVFDHDLTIIGQDTSAASMYASDSAPAVADLNGDGTADIIARLNTPDAGGATYHALYTNVVANMVPVDTLAYTNPVYQTATTAGSLMPAAYNYASRAAIADVTPASNNFYGIEMIRSGLSSSDDSFSYNLECYEPGVSNILYTNTMRSIGYKVGSLYDGVTFVNADTDTLMEVVMFHGKNTHVPLCDAIPENTLWCFNMETNLYNVQADISLSNMHAQSSYIWNWQIPAEDMSKMHPSAIVKIISCETPHMPLVIVATDYNKVYVLNAETGTLLYSFETDEMPVDIVVANADNDADAELIILDSYAHVSFYDLSSYADLAITSLKVFRSDTFEEYTKYLLVSNAYHDYYLQINITNYGTIPSSTGTIMVADSVVDQFLFPWPPAQRYTYFNSPLLGTIQPKSFTNHYLYYQSPAAFDLRWSPIVVGEHILSFNINDDLDNIHGNNYYQEKVNVYNWLDAKVDSITCLTGDALEGSTNKIQVDISSVNPVVVPAYVNVRLRYYVVQTITNKDYIVGAVIDEKNVMLPPKKSASVVFDWYTPNTNVSGIALAAIVNMNQYSGRDFRLANAANIDFAPSVKRIEEYKLNYINNVKYTTISTVDGDTDNDGIPDWYEDMYTNYLDKTNPADAQYDPDGEGLVNLEEYRAGTLIMIADTDGDMFCGYGNDYHEAKIYGTDPTDTDTDDGGIQDGYELCYMRNYGYDPLNPEDDTYIVDPPSITLLTENQSIVTQAPNPTVTIEGLSTNIVGSVWLTNMSMSSSVVIPAEADGTIWSGKVPIQQGNNYIYAYGTNSAGVYAVSQIVVIYGLSYVQVLPFIDITTNDPLILTYDESLVPIPGTNNMYVTGYMAWTNLNNNTAGTFSATQSWISPLIPLSVGTNVISIAGTNAYETATNDIVTVIRGITGTGTPFTDITNQNDTVIYDVLTYSIGGTNDPDVKGYMWWTNELNAVNGSMAVTSPWEIVDIPLAVGTNAITVFATNHFDLVTNDTVYIVRDIAGTGEPYVDVTDTNAILPYSSNSYVVHGTNNINVVGGMNWVNFSMGINGNFAAAGAWSSSPVPLQEGENLIFIIGTNQYGMSSLDSVKITRKIKGTMSPFVNITNNNMTVPFDKTYLSIAGTNNHHVLGTMSWVNGLTGSNGTFSAEKEWSVNHIYLAEGQNTIIVTGTNLMNQMAADSVFITRSDVPSDAPFLDIVTTNSIVNYSITSINVAGTNNAYIVGDMMWTNSLSGVNGTVPATNQWSIPVDLDIGTNIITVTGTNTTGLVTNDMVHIIRKEFIPGEPIVAITSMPVTVEYPVTDYIIAGTNNDAVVGFMQWTNILNGAAGAFSATQSWIVSVPIAEGMNQIQISGTNVAGTRAVDFIDLTRKEWSTVAPYIDITNQITSVAYDVDMYDLYGTNNAFVAGDLIWFSHQYAVTGSIPAVTGWSITNVPLIEGTNVITVTGTNLYNFATNDYIEVIRATRASIAPYLNITNAPFMVANDVDTCTLAGTNNTYVTGMIIWTNETTTAAGAFAAQPEWTVSAIPLTIGANSISVIGTNEYGDMYVDSITITRDPIGMPYVNITTDVSQVSFFTADITIAGTNNQHVVGGMSWENDATAVNGTLPATDTWSIPGVQLVYGDNLITVEGTNAYGVVYSDSITVTRDPVGPPVVTITNEFQKVTFGTASGSIGGSNNAFVVGTMRWVNIVEGEPPQTGAIQADTHWSVHDIDLAVGTNTIYVSGTNVYGVLTNDVALIERTEYVPGDPLVYITNSNETVAWNVNNYTVTGSNNAYVVGYMTVTNQLNNYHAAFPATSPWNVNVTLAEGDNVIRVTGTNDVGTVAFQTLTITREAEPADPLVYITTPGTNLTWDSRTYVVEGSNNAHVVGNMTWSTDQGENGTIPAAPQWIISNIVLQIHTNVITVTGTNVTGVVTNDSITVIRGIPGTGNPVLAITTPQPTGIVMDLFYEIQGTNNPNVVGMITWTNSLGDSGQFATASSWSRQLPLYDFTNVFTFAGENLYGITSEDSITVITPEPGSLLLFACSAFLFGRKKKMII